MKTKRSKESSPKYIKHHTKNKEKKLQIRGREILNFLPSHCILFQKIV